MFDKCPGASFIRTPTIDIKKCPRCGEEVEIFSNEMQTSCPKCEFVIYNNLESCIQWCQYARECVGDEIYEKLKRNEE